MLSQVTRYIASRWSIPAGQLEVSVRRLSGGLESSVMRATVHCAGRMSGTLPTRFIIKELRGPQRREAAIYRELWNRSEAPPAVRLLGSEAAGDAEYLYLEDIKSSAAWPWAHTAAAAAVCRALARLHDSLHFDGATLRDWDYEAELAQSAQETLALALSARDSSGVRCWRRVGDLQRVVAALPTIRARILDDPTFIHGDVHSGNLFVRGASYGSVVLIDWARARLGSPLEDVASWLHSLGCWEPEARRRHDTLLRSYLEARACPQTITTDLRTRYWHASASNGLSGAIRYHLAVLCDGSSSARMRSNSRRVLAAWERVIRRVAAILATTPEGSRRANAQACRRARAPQSRRKARDGNVPTRQEKDFRGLRLPE
jgi:aminoglycoside phosphotransferase (APT) family kinase protein